MVGADPGGTCGGGGAYARAEDDAVSRTISKAVVHLDIFDFFISLTPINLGCNEPRGGLSSPLPVGGRGLIALGPRLQSEINPLGLNGYFSCRPYVGLMCSLHGPSEKKHSL
jgi:hypothetical protein